jgi:tripartite-type tricarboxylate transporter receptor subunit TctC
MLARAGRGFDFGIAARRPQGHARERQMINPFRIGSFRLGSFRFGLPLLGVLVLSVLWPEYAPAQNYPMRPITMIVPFAAGGLTDVPARVLAAMLQERIGQNIVVENKPGGSGTLGGSYAVRAAPDGYTLFANSIADAQNLYFLPVPYNAIDDFAMIGMIVEGPPLVLIVDAALPYKSLDELLADARANPNKISFGTSGPATSPAMALAQLNALGKTAIAGVPFNGSGEAARNVTASGVQGAFAFYAQAKPLADSGKVRALAIASPQRIATWPEVPTMQELGFPNFDYRGFVGLASPAKTPAPIIAYLNKALNDVVQSQDFKSRMAALGMTVPAENTPEGLADYMRRETKRQGELAALTGIKMTTPRRIDQNISSEADQIGHYWDLAGQ